METRHTPGPWTAGETKPIAGVAVERGWFIGPERGHDIAQVHLTASQNAATQAANARLIAAAPDMLATLEELFAFLGDEFDGYGHGSPQWSYLDRIEAVVSKAKGGA